MSILDKKTACFQRLKELYNQMDQAWHHTANQYGFQCTGCKENCCETKFYHHTLIEKEFLLLGFSLLPPQKAEIIRHKAKSTINQWKKTPPQEEPLRIMCPANEGGQCLLYTHRPMICRLHGIPHEMRQPDGRSLCYPGCNEGTPLFEKTGYIPFDRTLFYKEMASIEMEYRTIRKMQKKIKQTVAEMISEA